MTHDEYVVKLATLCKDYNYNPVEARKVLEEHEAEIYPNEGLQEWALEYGDLYASAAVSIVDTDDAIYITKKALEFSRDLKHKSTAHIYMLLFTMAALSTGGIHLREMAWAMCSAYKAGVHDQILDNLKDLIDE